MPQIRNHDSVYKKKTLIADKKADHKLSFDLPTTQKFLISSIMEAQHNNGLCSLHKGHFPPYKNSH